MKGGGEKFYFMVPDYQLHIRERRAVLNQLYKKGKNRKNNQQAPSHRTPYGPGITEPKHIHGVNEILYCVVTSSDCNPVGRMN